MIKGQAHLKQQVPGNSTPEQLTREAGSNVSSQRKWDPVITSTKSLTQMSHPAHRG